MSARRDGPIKAAQYLRMSREHQRYSIGNQQAVIAAYAAARGYEVVRTYTDSGLSGLTLKGRSELQRLLADALGGQAGFSVILVHDVSRWGRFQDPDQSAHYEFICREAGVKVEYCAEPFENDGSMVSGIVKHLKRAMAAEYSRELSGKIARAQRRASEQGYWRGSAPPYGFRRCAIAPDGSYGQVLHAGERPSQPGYRVMLVPGPAAEVATVRRIYRLFAIHGLSVRAITALLVSEAEDEGPAWSTFRVRRLLTDEKYTGVMVAGRVRCTLKQVTVQPKSAWVRVPGACERLVDQRLFDLVQQNLPRRREGASDDVLIDQLRALLATHGRLSNDIIERDPRAHCPSVYIKRFGGLFAAYALAGFEPSAQQRLAATRVGQHKPHLSRNRRPRRSDEQMLADLRALLDRHGRLTTSLIDGDPGSASSSEYRRRFGDMGEIYKLMNYRPSKAQQRSLGWASQRRRLLRPDDPMTAHGEPAVRPPDLPSSS